MPAHMPIDSIPELPWTPGEPPQVIDGRIYLLDLGGEEDPEMRYVLVQWKNDPNTEEADGDAACWVTLNNDETIDCEVEAYVRIA